MMLPGKESFPKRPHMPYAKKVAVVGCGVRQVVVG